MTRRLPTLRCSCRVLALVAPLFLASVGQADAQDTGSPTRSAPRVEEKPEALTDEERAHLSEFERPALKDGLAMRVGFSFHNMFGSHQGRPLIYPHFGVRLKSDKLYIDAHLPALIGGLDYLQYKFQERILGTDTEFNLFGALNQPMHYVFFEVGHVRIGSTKELLPGRLNNKLKSALKLSGGVVGFADFVVFEARSSSETIEDGEALENLLTRDPGVLGAGLFGSIGSSKNNFSYDLAVEVGRDLWAWQAYEPNPGWMLSADVDLQFDIVENLGGFIRTRATYYTHGSRPRVFGTNTATGITFRF